MCRVIVTDEVEIGHNKFYGGSTKISIEWNNVTLDDHVDYIREGLLEIIDKLDHSMIIDNEDAGEYYKRYFVIDKDDMKNFYNDVASIIFKYISLRYSDKNNISVAVELNKTKVVFEYNDIDEDTVWRCHGY